MAKAYMVVTYRKIKKPEAIAAYAKLAGPAVQAAGYQAALRVLGKDAAERDMRIVEGAD